MKDIDIDALEKILVTFENHVSLQEKLLQEFRVILDDVRNAKKGRGYQRNPEYYKAKVRMWEKTNPEKVKEYNRKYQAKKKAERLSNVLDLVSQGKTVSEISTLLSISEKMVLSCLKQNETIPFYSENKEEES
jgi:DNA-binding NarL/FixJ family response regulator